MKNGIRHSYQGIKDTSSSEYQHLLMLDHFRTKISAEVHQKLPHERRAIKRAINNYPNKNHEPV